MAGEAKHTPGPWLAAAGPSSIVGWPIVANTGRVIGDVAWMPHMPREGEAYEETKANATLISAAPDLLEACQSICGVFEGQDDVPRYVQKARAAIAKATDNQH